MNMSQHLDYDALNSLKDIMEDDFTFLIETFLQDSSERLSSLSTVVQGVDGDAIRRTAHSFKGSCGNVGALRLSDLCGHLEHKALTGDFSGIQNDYSAIKEEFTVVEKLLKDYMC